MYSTIDGEVEAISKTRNGIKIVGHDWLNNKFQTVDPSINKGDVVSVSAKDGKFWNKILTTGGAPSTTTQEVQRKSEVLDLPVYLPRERAIIRQNALTNAVNYATGGTHTVDTIIDIARQFEAYTSGQIDKLELDEALKNTVSEAS